MKYLRYLRYTKSLYWTNYLLKNNIPIEDFRLNKDGRLFIRSANYSFSKGEFDVYFKTYSKYNWKFIENNINISFSEKEIFVNVTGLKIKIETVEDWYIINEIFIENIYNVRIPGDYILIDVGMNIGITSLYFSTKDFIKKTYSFEPVKLTYEAAIENFQLNEVTAKKITPFNYGLGSSNRTNEVLFDRNNKGKTSIINQNVNPDAKHIRIEIRNVVDEFLKIIDENPEINDIILKLDCEGAEYEILQELHKHRLLDRIRVVLLEWHKIEKVNMTVNDIIELFEKNSFCTFPLTSMQGDIGMMYCVRV